MVPLWACLARSLASLAIWVRDFVRILDGDDHQAPVGVHSHAQVDALKRRMVVGSSMGR